MATKAKRPQERHRGQIIPKGDGKWLVRFYNGRDSSGRRLYPSSVVEGTFSQAQKALTSLLSQADSKTYVSPSKVTVKEYIEQWLTTKTSLGPKTKREYENRMKKDVYPLLGGVKLDQLTPLRIQQLYAGMSARGLSPRTVEFTHTVLHQALEQAVRFDMLVKNPAAHVELPRKEHTEQLVFSPAQASLFLEKTSGHKLHPLWVFLLTSGCRPQEALALQWSDFTEDLGVVRIQRALVEVEAGRYEPRETKTARSKRAISVPQETARVLREHRKALGLLGGYVFPSATGSHLDLANVRHAWKKAIRDVNKTLLPADELPKVKLYGARHTHITHLLMLNVHPQVAADRAGHSSIAVTMGTYSHVLPEVDREAGDKVGSLLFRRTGT